MSNQLNRRKHLTINALLNAGMITFVRMNRLDHTFQKIYKCTSCNQELDSSVVSKHFMLMKIHKDEFSKIKGELALII